MTETLSSELKFALSIATPNLVATSNARKLYVDLACYNSGIVAVPNLGEPMTLVGSTVSWGGAPAIVNAGANWTEQQVWRSGTALTYVGVAPAARGIATFMGSQVFISSPGFVECSLGPNLWRDKQAEGICAADLCADRLECLMSSLESMPASYNKLLFQGAAQYCIRVLKRLDEGNRDHCEFLNDIREFTSTLGNLRKQYTDTYASSFERLDLQSVEDTFDSIQNKSERLRVFPTLQNATTQELVQD